MLIIPNISNLGQILPNLLMTLTYNKWYGLRIQDDQISLNVPDVTKVLAVYESLNKNSPTFDRIECTSTSNVDTNTVVGKIFLDLMVL